MVNALLVSVKEDKSRKASSEGNRTSTKFDSEGISSRVMASNERKLCQNGCGRKHNTLALGVRLASGALCNALLEGAGYHRVCKGHFSQAFRDAGMYLNWNVIELLT